jgi:hypothetical protein
MSNLADFLNEVSNDSQNATNVVGGFIGTVADLAGAFSGVVDFLNWFSHLGQPADDAVQAALSKLQATIDAAIQATDTGVAALGLQSNYQNIDSIVDPARGVFGSLPIIDPNDVTSVTAAIETCYTALISLRDDAGSKWTVPWAGGASSYTDGWSGNLYPPHTDFVFSYTYALPQFLRTIGIFLTVIAVLKPSALTAYLADLNQCIQKLTSLNNTIVATPSNGLVGTLIPQPHQVEYVYPQGDLEALLTDWSDGNQGHQFSGGEPGLWPFGAVEEYSGASIVDSYWPYLPFQINPDVLADSAITDGLMRLLRLRIENRRKALYSKVGMPDTIQMIKTLQIITRQPVLDAQPFEAWSFRAALSILGITLNGAGAFRSLAAFLKPIPPYCGGLLFPPQAGDTYPAAPLPKSFRALFSPI